MFSFIIRSAPGSRHQILRLCQQYNPGITILRHEFKRYRDGTIGYIVDVYEATPYGLELLDWLRRGRQYEKERKNPHFPNALCGPVWCETDSAGNMVSTETWNLRLFN